MAPDRISNAIESLITHLVPAGEDESEEAAQEHHDRCFDLARSVLERYSCQLLSKVTP